VPNAAAVESAQLEPIVRNSSVGAASALVGGGIMIGAVAYEKGSLSRGAWRSPRQETQARSRAFRA
jgi:hypothetical protein